MLNLFITLLVGSAGAFIAHKIKMPAGPMLGAMIAVGIYNCLGFVSFMPSELRVGVQIVMGCILGLRLNRETFIQLKTVVKPVLIVIPCLMIGDLYSVKDSGKACFNCNSMFNDTGFKHRLCASLCVWS